MKTKHFPYLSPLGCVGATIASAGLLLSPLLSHPAHACGGFWCSQAAPVDQVAEQIIFVDNPDETVTAVIQIAYEGPSKKFAWVIPIPGKPKIGVSSNVAFQRLEQATAPEYNLERVVEGTCRQSGEGGDRHYSIGNEASSDAGALPVSDSSPVVVVDQGSVGPYDYAVISVDPKPADAAIKWFNTEGYDLTGVDAELLGPYLEDGLNLLAFRLTKGSDAGAIRPVVLTYASELPMIPLRPTAVAARDDMGIKVWVVADKQAVPKNYKSLVINDALINWFDFRENYDAVVTAAANEAQGQGFVTELAEPTEKLADRVFSPDDEAQWTQLKSRQYADGIEAIFAASDLYRGWDGWREAVEGSVKLPDGANFDDFGRNPDLYRTSAQVDTATFFAQLDDKLLKPARETQQLLQSRPYLTRLYSTMSADEMTLDPAFTYNGDLADISNVHTAEMHVLCNASVYEFEAPWRIVLPQRGVVRGVGDGGWPIPMDGMPANLKIVQLSTVGSGEIVTDNREEISARLFKLTRTMPGSTSSPRPPTNRMTIGGDQQLSPTNAAGDSAGGGGSECAVAEPGTASSGATLWALPLLGWLSALRLRRRRG
jgi:hypothetical protein